MGAFLRWAGSKRKILPQLNALLEASNAQHYIEPFCGSACLYFESQITDGCISDSNEWLIHTYLEVQKNPKGVHEKLSALVNSDRIYNQMRRVHPSKMHGKNKAAYFIYLNRYCFNGLFRTNKKGFFNVPYAPRKTGKIPDLDTLELAAEKLRRTSIFCGDFEEVTVDNLRKDSVVYLDPPYATKNRRIFRQYDSASFGTDDMSRLDRLLHKIDRRGAKFILSYAKVTEISEIASKWIAQDVHVSRNIAGFSSHRKLDSEHLITNF